MENIEDFFDNFEEGDSIKAAGKRSSPRKKAPVQKLKTTPALQSKPPNMPKRSSPRKDPRKEVWRSYLFSTIVPRTTYYLQPQY